MQLYYAFTIMRKFAEKKNDTEYIAYLDKTQKDIGEKIRAASFHPEHEKSTAHPCRKSTLKAH